MALDPIPGREIDDPENGGQRGRWRGVIPFGACPWILTYMWLSVVCVEIEQVMYQPCITTLPHPFVQFR
jgi:hypothetical protein